MSTTPLPFTKMEGIGNDYVYVDGFRYPVAKPEKLAPIVSDRHFGVGADGLILILPADEGRIEDGFLRMRMFNADGSEAEMCGNGIRCVARYAFSRGLTSKRELRIQTLGGQKEIVLNGTGKDVLSVRVDMGEPRLRPDEIPLAIAGGETKNVPVEIGGETFLFTAVNMGNPHAVIFVPEITDRLVHQVGPQIERHPLFPKRTNVEFIEVKDRSTLRMRVWERGSGETLACGTGACASLVAAVSLGLAERRATIELLGGNLEIFWPDEAQAKAAGVRPGRVYMTGPTRIVFDGVIEVDGELLTPSSAQSAKGA